MHVIARIEHHSHQQDSGLGHFTYERNLCRLEFYFPTYLSQALGAWIPPPPVPNTFIYFKKNSEANPHIILINFTFLYA